MFILGSGDQASTAQQLAKIFGEAFQDKYFAEGQADRARQKQKMANTVRYLMTQAASPVPEHFKSTCENVLAKETRENVEAAFNFQ